MEWPELTLLRDELFGTVRGVQVELGHFSDGLLTPDRYLNRSELIQPLLLTTPGGTTSAVIRVSRNASGDQLDGTSWRDQFEWSPNVYWWAVNLNPPEVRYDAASSAADYMDFEHSWTCIDVGGISVGLTLQADLVTTGTYSTATGGGSSLNLCLAQDILDDSITSISTTPPTAPAADVDLRIAGGAAAVFNAADAALHFNNAVYECGASTPEMAVVCPAGVQPMPAGEVFMYGMQMQAAAASDATYRYIYSVVLDSDGNTANNWQPQGPYDWDLFQGADRWYQLERALDGTWRLEVSQVDDNQNINRVNESTVRAVIRGDSILFFISASEMSASAPGYRLTSFKDRGNFNFSDLAADVSGTDPTEPLAITIRPDQ